MESVILIAARFWNRPFPLSLRSLDDFPSTAPASWLQRGGVVLPMDQSEALWISPSARYPCAGKIAAGTINAVSGAAWTAELQSEPQDYVVAPGQPWLDGFFVGEGRIRQFQAPVGRLLLAKALQPDYPFPMPAAVRREFTLRALDGALAAAARQVRESLMKKGLPRYILEDGALIRIAPDGTRKPMRRTSAVAKRGPKPGRRGR